MTPKFAEAYPVFIMYEQLNLNGFFEDDYSLDTIWAESCTYYDKFLNSEYNKETQSEYDCIAQYVKNLAIFYNQKN
jgi:hypothetical protein